MIQLMVLFYIFLSNHLKIMKVHQNAQKDDFMKNDKIIGSIIFLILSGIFIILTLNFPSSNQDFDVGPAFIPRISAAFLTLLSLILVIQGIIENNKGGQKEKVSLYSNVFLVFSSIILFIVYVFLIPIIGFYFTSSMFIVIFLLLNKVK